MPNTIIVRLAIFACFLACAATGATALAQSPEVGTIQDGVKQPSTDDCPRPTPLTRPEMKLLLEDMKNRRQRIPLPAGADKSMTYEARLGQLFLPASVSLRSYLNFSGSSQTRSSQTGGTSNSNRPVQEPDPTLTLEYAFKTRLFWIASRANNCQYCLGHQESKLLAVGMNDDRIAALDSDWIAFPPEEQVAFALARRLTLEPHALRDADIDQCRKHYSELQILEMILSVAGNNAINRWKEGIGVPQSSGGGNFGASTRPSPTALSHSYLTDTSEIFRLARSKVIAQQNPSEAARMATVRSIDRNAEVVSIEKGLALCATRKSRLPMVSHQRTKEILGELVADMDVERLPGWMRLLANFPIAGKRQVAGLLATETELELSPRLRAEMAWIIARQNGAWYSLSAAEQRLIDLGIDGQEIVILDQSLPDASSQFASSDPELALLVVARNLAASPVILTDRQVDRAVKLAGPRAVVQTVHYTAMRSLMDRFTEAAALPSDPVTSP